MISPSTAHRLDVDLFGSSSDSTPDAILDLTHSTVFGVLHSFLTGDDDAKSPYLLHRCCSEHSIVDPTQDQENVVPVVRGFEANSTPEKRTPNDEHAPAFKHTPKPSPKKQPLSPSLELSPGLLSLELRGLECTLESPTSWPAGDLFMGDDHYLLEFLDNFETL